MRGPPTTTTMQTFGSSNAMSDEGDRGYEPQNLVRHFAASFAVRHGRFDIKAFVMIVVSSFHRLLRHRCLP
jgi:hypothetical protein